MIDFISQYEPVLRVAVFLSALALLVGFEIISPRRFIGARRGRWQTNFLLGGANMLLLRVVLPGGLVALAFSTHGGGVFGWLNMPLWAEIIVSLIVLDFVIYAQHVAFHHVPLLWPLHAAHHAEQTLDVTSGLRFHPGEALVSLGIKAVAIVVLGVHPVAVIIFEILLSSTSLFTHANVDLGRWDGRLQTLFVSPDMHRLHHSKAEDESRRNFGTWLSVWDKIFATYRATPHIGHERLPLGLAGFRQGGLIEALRHPLRHFVRRP